MWQQGAKCRLGIADKAKVHLSAESELLTADVDLHNRRIFREELLIWKVRPNHQHQITIHHGVITGRESEQTCHPHIKRIVVLDEFLPTHCMNDRGVELACELYQLSVGSGAAGASEDRDSLRAI